LKTTMTPLPHELAATNPMNSVQFLPAGSIATGCGLVGIVCLGLVLRSHALGAVHSWFDESFSWRMAQFSFPEIIARSERDVHPPFHFLVLGVWSRLFGPSLLSLRLSSMLFGLGTILGGFFLASAACGSMSLSRRRTAGLVAALLISLSSLQIHWSQQARMYTLGTCLTVWSTWMLLRWFQSGGTLRLIGYVLLAGGLALQHHYGTFTVFAQLTFALGRSARRAVAGSWQNEFLPVVLAGWATFSLWALWLPSFLLQRSQVKASYWTHEFRWQDVLNVWSELFLFGSSIKRSPTISWLLAELVLASVLLLLVHRQPGARLVGWLVLIPYGMAVAWSALDENVFVSRFLIHAHVCLLIGVGILIASLPFRGLRLGMTLLVVLGMSVTAYQQSLKRTRSAEVPGMPAAVSLLRGAKAEQDLVLVCNPMLYLNLCVYHAGLDNVYAFDPGQGFPHFQGAPVMKDEEYLRPEDLQKSDQDWVWTLDAENWLGGTWKVHLPAKWQLQEEKKIREWYATLVVRSYHREPAFPRSSSVLVEEREHGQ